MNLAIDIQSLQTPSRNRGIGRYVGSLLEKLLPLLEAGGLRCQLFADQTLAAPTVIATLGCPIRYVDFGALGGNGSRLRQLFLQTTLLGARADAVFLPSPIEEAHLPDFTDFPATLYSISYDMIPLVFAEQYLGNAAAKASYLRRAANIRHSDTIFAISEATRRDTIRYLDVEPAKIRTVMAGVSPFFRPLSVPEQTTWREQLAGKFGINKEYVLFTGGEEWRKNMDGLIEAYAQLPAAVRQRFVLVIACKLSEAGREALMATAARRGVKASVVLTNFVSDEELRALYAGCALFTFPSLYEGFGLPLVEAMACGAPVCAGDNSSLTEIISAPDQLFDARAPRSIAARLEALLGDDARRRRLAAQAPGEAARFSWQSVAEKVAAAVHERAAERRGATMFFTRAERGEPTTKKRLAYFSPFPPVPSGISDYTYELLGPLGAHFELDLYHDENYVPRTPAGEPAFTTVQFERNVHAAKRHYAALVYQMGNSDAHGYLYAFLRRYAGITVLHDYNLNGMLSYLGEHRADFGIKIETEMEHSYGPTRASQLLDQIRRGELSVGDLPERGIYTNRRIFSRSLGVVVHSQWAHDQALKEWGHECPFITRIPQLMSVAQKNENTADEKRRLHEKLGLPARGQIIASLGYVSVSKRPLPLLEAFARHLARFPDAFLVFVGATEHMVGNMDVEIRRRGLRNRVTITGFVSMEQLYEYIAVSDVCVSLRYPHSGETSAALLRILSHGKPTIVTNVGSFADFPDQVVHKIPTPDRCDEVSEIVRALDTLSTDAAYRDGLGRAALAFIARENDPKRCAQLYADFVSTVMAAPETWRKLLADHVGREAGRMAGGSDDARALLAPFVPMVAGITK